MHLLVDRWQRRKLQQPHPSPRHSRRSADGGKAWACFEAGDQDGYIDEIATQLRQVADQGEVIVLAQASMAGAAALCTDLPIPVLSSPSLGVATAVAAFRQQ